MIQILTNRSRMPAGSIFHQSAIRLASPQKNAPIKTYASPRYDWRSAEEGARAGRLPMPHDLSTNPRKNQAFRWRFGRIMAMAEKGDIAGLKGECIKPYDSSTKIMGRWRYLAVMALEARTERSQRSAA